MCKMKMALGAIVAAAIIMIAGCSMNSGKDDVVKETESQKYLVLNIDADGIQSKMISTGSYDVTKMEIEIEDPRGTNVASFEWESSFEDESYKTAVNKIGDYSIKVTHIGEDNGKTSEYTETATVYVGPMIITEITIVPGFVGQTDVCAIDGSNVKNIILLISDGCGYNHVDAASLYQYGATGTQVYESWPVNVGMSHYMYGDSYDANEAWADFDYVKNGATDSAAAATAMSTGEKTFSGSIGKDMFREDLVHIAALFEEKGRSTGVITSVEWTHATPAAFAAHNVSRNNYTDIGREMIFNSSLDVIMGAGHPWYDHDGNLKSSPNSFKYVGGEETWNALSAGTAASDADGDGDDDAWTLVQTKDEFQALMTGFTPDRVCGVAQVYQTLQYNRAGDGKADAFSVPFIDSVPSLEDMTKAAINVLDNNSNGFFLMVEGGAVDWAGHGNADGRVIEEEVDFNKSVEAVIAWVEENSSWDETLVIVTGDHETGYLTGPGSGNGVWAPLVNNGAGEQPGLEWHSGSHTNSLIPFYAKGEGSELFNMLATDIDPVRGYYLDNTDLGNVMKYLVSE